jgi:MOSC domain-containing protein YiiM
MTTRSDSPSGVVESLNVGTRRLVQANGHSVLSAIWKHSVKGPVALRDVNFRGDDQARSDRARRADKAVHGYGVVGRSASVRLNRSEDMPGALALRSDLLNC